MQIQINDIEINSKEQLVSYLRHAANSAHRLGDDFTYKVLLALFDMYEANGIYYSVEPEGMNPNKS